MAVLLRAHRAILDVQKLVDYCLNPTHPRGRHKARVFRHALGIDRQDAAWLRESLLQGLTQTDAVELASDEFGSRWRVDIPIVRQERRVVVRSVWIVPIRESLPRFVSCWVL